MECTLCGIKFEDSDEVVETIEGLYHEEDCFTEYCYDLLAINIEEWGVMNDE